MEPNYRRCISCRKVASKQAFWRIVRVRVSQAAPTVPLETVPLETIPLETIPPDAVPLNSVQLDRGMGRSAYLCPQATCLQLAQKKNRLGRALKATVTEGLYQTLWQRLADQQAVQPE